MANWTMLKVSTRHGVDKAKKFSMTKFLHAQKRDVIKSELIFNADVYPPNAPPEDQIGNVYHISIRNCLNSVDVESFLNNFVEQTPYKFIEVTHGVFEK